MMERGVSQSECADSVRPACGAGGRNGAGKSTFIKLLLGLYEPKQGSILVDGRSVKDRTPKERKRLFAAAFQDFTVIRYR